MSVRYSDSPPNAVRVLVCGNLDRGDDGAALRATSALRGHEVLRVGQLDVEHLIGSCTGVPLVIVDAAVGVAPGHVVTIPLHQLMDGSRGPAPRSSHALPIDQVLGIANQLVDVPIEGIFVGIGGEDFGFGGELSPAVRRGMPAFEAAIDHAAETLASTVVNGGH